MKTVKDYISNLEKLESITQVLGKPQAVQINNGHLYWLQGKCQELFSVPLNDTLGKDVPKKVITVSDPHKTQDGEEKLTKEAELLRERTRSNVTGISSFRIRSSDEAIFYISNGDLFVYYTKGPLAREAPLNVFNFLTEKDKKHFESTGKPNMYIQHLTETVGKGLAASEAVEKLTTLTFVNNHNVYIAKVEENLTDRAKPFMVTITQVTSVGDPQHEFGVADYITQEEFGRYSGQVATEAYVLFSYTDITMLREVALLDAISECDDDVQKMAYSRVGDPNARTTLVVYEIKTGKMRYLPCDSILKVAPWAEYIPRFGFNSANSIYVSVLSRTQEEYAVLKCKIDDLPHIDEGNLKSLYSGSKEKLPLEPLPNISKEWSQSIPWAWVEIPKGAPIMYGDDCDLIVCHDAQSETAHYHLFSRPSGSGENSWSQLTSGKWNVTPGTIRVCGKKVYFIANAHNRLQKMLYSVPLPLDGKCSAPFDRDQLSLHSEQGKYVYEFAVSTQHICYIASDSRNPASIYVTPTTGSVEPVKIPGEWVPSPSKTESESLLEFCGNKIVIPKVITTLNRRGVPVSFQLFVSPKVSLDKPNPIVLHIYGGPHAQLVHENNFDASCRIVVQGLLQEGISVAVADNQQSPANGLRDLSICKKKMGYFETTDYLDIVNCLCDPKQSPSFIPDRSRIGIFGWSYGGYATLLAMCQAPDVFKIGCSGAPVGDWTLYDTGYTERYMGILDEGNTAAKNCGGPKSITQAYQNSTIKHFAKGFPDELNRVFIAHGLLDENVHFSHSCSIVKALIDEAKPYTMHIYPGERHGLRQDKKSRMHYDGNLIKIFSELL